MKLKKTKKNNRKINSKNNRKNPNHKINMYQYTIDEIKSELKNYIKQEGFIEDAKSFGTRSSGYDRTHESEPVPNLWNYYVLVSIDGFMDYLDKNKNYYHMMLERIKEEGTRLELDSYVRTKMHSHNQRGLSIGHINPQSYKSWYSSTFERDEIEFKKEMNKIKLAQEKIRLEQLEKIANENENENNSEEAIANNMAMLANLMNNAK